MITGFTYRSRSDCRQLCHAGCRQPAAVDAFRVALGHLQCRVAEDGLDLVRRRASFRERRTRRGPLVGGAHFAWPASGCHDLLLDQLFSVAAELGCG